MTDTMRTGRTYWAARQLGHDGFDVLVDGERLGFVWGDNPASWRAAVLFRGGLVVLMDGPADRRFAERRLATRAVLMAYRKLAAAGREESELAVAAAGQAAGRARSRPAAGTPAGVADTSPPAGGRTAGEAPMVS